jgi:predicted CoA-binding protein
VATAPPDGELRALLASTRTVAVVGASSNPERASHGVVQYLRDHTDFDVWPVNPNEPEVLGLPAYPSLQELPGAPDIVDVFRKAEDLPEVAEQAVAAGAKVFWSQLGLSDDEAGRLAGEAGLTVVMDHCIKAEHARLIGPG